MLPLKLIPRNLGAHWLRTLLTIGSLTVAVFLVCILRSLVVAVDAGVRSSASNRLMVQSSVSLFVDLPLSYQADIDACPGVTGSTKFNWFGGKYPEIDRLMAQFGVDDETFLDLYPEVDIIEGSAEDFEKGRTTCLIGKNLARDLNRRVGDTIPVRSAIYPRTDGRAWEFQVAGIYAPTSSNVAPDTLFFHFDYVEEAILAGDVLNFDRAGVGVYVVGLERAEDAEMLAASIDQLFANGEQRVQTNNEAEFQKQFVGMLGNIPQLLSTIGIGVVFAIALAVLNTMLMAARERTRDVGIMKALGFTDRTMAALFVVEAMVVCGAGGVLGAGLALASEAGVVNGLGGMFPGYRVEMDTVLQVLGGALALGLIAALVPAWRIGRLEPVQAFRMEI